MEAYIHVCHVSTWEAEAGPPWFHSEIQSTLHYMSLCLKKLKMRMNKVNVVIEKIVRMVGEFET